MTSDWNERAQDGSPRSELGLADGITVEEVLDAACLRTARVLAGGEGIHRVVERLNVMEVPDILPWVKPSEFLLTTAYPLRESPAELVDLVAQLDDRGLAGIGIKLGRYVEEVPPRMLAQADRLKFPLVQLPDDVAFDDVLNQVLSHILNRQSASLARSQEIHRTLIAVVLAGGDLPELAREVARLLGGSTVIVGLDGVVLASYGDAYDPQLLESAGIVHGRGLDLASGARGIETPEGTRRFVHVPVLAGGRWNASIITFEGERRLRDDDIVTLEIAATITALVVTRAHAVAAVESKFQSEFLHELLNRKVMSAEEAVARAAQFGWDLDRVLIVLVGELHDPQVRGADEPALRLSRMARALMSFAHRTDRHAAVVTLSREIIVITSFSTPQGGIDLDQGAWRAIVDELADIEPSARVGVSRPVDGAMQVVDGYWQARKALDVGQRFAARNTIVRFDDLGAFRVLSLIHDESEIGDFVREVLGELAAPHGRNEELLQTLEALFDHNLNVAETARAMHYHYNTMRYRVEKLEDLLGPFTTSADVRFSLQLALHLQRLCVS